MRNYCTASLIVALATVLSITGGKQCAVSAFAPTSSRVVPKSVSSFSALDARAGKQEQQKEFFMPEGIVSKDENHNSKVNMVAALATVGPLVTFADSANAATAAASNAIPSALFAYGHYACLFAIVGCVTAERLTVKANMSVEEEKALGYYDIGLGLFGVLLLVTGYYRAVEYGKGWDFYSHEPIFWLKMAGVGIFGGLSLFPTITIIKRTVALQLGGDDADLPPMSEKLASRMKSVLNAELSALAVIPLTATLMSRAVGYVDDFPTQIVGPAGTAVITAAAVYKYVSEALSWEEEN